MGELKAAASAIDLNARPGQWMTGYGGRVDPAIGTHDPLTARAVMLDSGGTRLVVVACDLLGFEPAFVKRLRRQLKRKVGLPESALLVACTHTHSGAASMPMRGQMGNLDNDWLQMVQRRLFNLVCSLSERLEPAQLAWGSTTVPGVGFNRQDRSHGVDAELVALTVERRDGSSIATLVNYATHAVVLGPQNLLFSGDFPGAVARRIDDLTGGVGLYLQGACGDVDPVTQLEKGWGRGTFDDCEEIGKRLAEAAVSCLAGRSRTASAFVNSALGMATIPLDEPPPLAEIDRLIRQFKSEQVEASVGSEPDRIKAQTAGAMLQWARSLRARMVRGTVPRELSIEIYAARINDLRIVGLPFETYTDIGLGIKCEVRSKCGPETPVMFVGYANGLYGYCPTTWAKEQGGYGADVSCRWFSALVTPIGRGADGILVREATALACGL
ncbi:MAG: neutral/alkaline non-lysosomal ceramidase N-terminal domain-containing protein [Armatimonadota bacterium]|nr:neutral/alkaline non-lysosomal ceramidase N-terminal domain-containing protein [Armatimonadota bacterium]